MKFIKKNKHFVVCLALAILYSILNYAFQLKFYWLLIALFVYLAVVALTHLPNAVGMTGYLLFSMTHRFEPFEKLMAWGFDRGCTNPATLAGYGLEMGRRFRFERALEAHERLLRQPDIPPMILKTARQNYSLAQWKCGDVKAALSTLEQMLSDYEYFGTDFYITLGFFYLETGQFDKAEEYTRKALEEEPGSASAYDNLGQIAYRRGDREEARAFFARAIELNRTIVDSKYYLGVMAEEDGDPEAAAVFFRSAAKKALHGYNTVTPEMLGGKLEKYGLPEAGALLYNDAISLK